MDTSLPVPTETHFAYAFIKRAMDVIGSFFSLTLFSPIWLGLAVIVKLDSPGPILYRRRVLGRGGAQFDAFKFRTMVINGDEILAAQPQLQAALLDRHKLKDDPRVTRSGRWLRKLSLDEVPQLVNILLGQMSLVGPRMISPVELAQYGSLAAELLSVKPGLTGLWQTSGRSDLSYADRVQLDLRYIRTRSIWLDAWLLLKTPIAVIKGRGAY
jgi:lipopolysaccharide/colanic/teichoic acid biosynthesis glycosyltransferase